MRFGDFTVRDLAGDGRDFDFEVDYLDCGNPALNDARTRTLADGCSHCDFRFKKNAKTRISSKTPEVQRTVEQIASRRSA